MRKNQKKKDPKTLGERIRFIRGDLTQSEFADILRIKQAMISRYEADKETPSPRVLLRIAQFSSRSIEWLLTGSDTIAASSAEDEVRRIGAKSTRHMSRDDLVEIAAGYLRDTKLPEVEEFVALMKDVFLDRKKLKKIVEFHRYLRFAENVEQGK